MYRISSAFIRLRCSFTNSFRKFKIEPTPTSHIYNYLAIIPFIVISQQQILKKPQCFFLSSGPKVKKILKILSFNPPFQRKTKWKTEYQLFNIKPIALLKTLTLVNKLIMLMDILFLSLMATEDGNYVILSKFKFYHNINTKQTMLEIICHSSLSQLYQQICRI